MSPSSKAHPFAVATAIAVGGLSVIPTATAQSNQKALEVLQDASKNRTTSLLLRIEATKREVSDQQMTVTFTGNVRVMLGDTTIRCDSLVANYGQSTALGGARATRPGPNGAQWIRKIVASGAVVLNYQNQSASSDLGVLDLDANLATLTGTVVVTQGQAVLRGDHFVVNLATGISRMESQRTPLPR
jgi:lipopolysaccharide export system protein LptA